MIGCRTRCPTRQSCTHAAAGGGGLGRNLWGFFRGLLFWWHEGGVGDRVVNVSVLSFKGTHTGQVPKNYSGIVRFAGTDSFSYRILHFLQTTATMHPIANRICPGCGRHFLPGGFTNHLKLTRDPRCKSIQNSIFRPPSGASPHQGSIPTPVPLHTPSSPAHEPSHIPDDLNPDIEMTDVSNGDQDLLSTDSGIDLPAPSQVAGVSGHHTDEQDGLDELFNVLPHHPSSHPFVISSDMDSDLSDDEDNNRQSHHRELVSPPGRLF